MDQCLRDVMLAQPMPGELLLILPKDSEALLMTEAFDLAHQVFNELDLRVEDDASDFEDYTMDECKSNFHKLCAALHWKIADSVLYQTIARSGGILPMILQDQTHIEDIVYVWFDLTIAMQVQIADTTSTKHYIVPLLLLGACEKDMSSQESYARLITCLDFVFDHQDKMFALDNKILLPKDWIDNALEALANGVSRYAVYMRGVAQQAAINLQRVDDFEGA